MATNFYFSNFNSSMEQTLIDDLMIESIKIYGIDLQYMPRTVVAKEEIFTETELVSFDKAVGVEMYIKNVNGWGGDGKFMSKFGLEIRDEITLNVAIRTWKKEVGRFLPEQSRPNEGDLIYFPLNKKCFQITYVNPEAIFYQLGALQMYEITCELFEHNGEEFNTGIKELDERYARTLIPDEWALMTESGFMLMTEGGNPIITEQFNIEDIDPTAQNDEIQDKSDLILDWSERDPFSEGGRY